MKIGSFAFPILGGEVSVETRANGQKVFVKRKAAAILTLVSSDHFDQRIMEPSVEKKKITFSLPKNMQNRPRREIRIVRSCSPIQSQNMAPPMYQPDNNAPQPVPIPAYQYQYPMAPPPVAPQYVNPAIFAGYAQPQYQPQPGVVYPGQPQFFMPGPAPSPSPGPMQQAPAQDTPQDQSTRFITPDDLKYRCSACGKFRSPAYHQRHPLPPGQLAPPTLCRKCRKRSDVSSDSDDEEDTRPDHRRRRKSFRSNRDDSPDERAGKYSDYDDDGYPRRRVSIVRRPSQRRRASFITRDERPESPAIVINVGSEASRRRGQSVDSIYADRNYRDDDLDEDGYRARSRSRNPSYVMRRRRESVESLEEYERSPRYASRARSRSRAVASPSSSSFDVIRVYEPSSRRRYEVDDDDDVVMRRIQQVPTRRIRVLDVENPDEARQRLRRGSHVDFGDRAYDSMEDEDRRDFARRNGRSRPRAAGGIDDIAVERQYEPGMNNFLSKEDVLTRYEKTQVAVADSSRLMQTERIPDHGHGVASTMTGT